MNSECFSKLEIDAIGEVLNISLGASATAVSTILNTRVDITTPVVNVMKKGEFNMGRVEPAVGVTITYVSGLEGKNVMLLKRHDVKVIVERMMGMEMSDEEFELNEMNISAVCEVMNQMMGASATALSEFLGKVVNISTPTSFEVDDVDEFKNTSFPNDSPMVVIGFTLKIADQMESEFFNIMPIRLAKSLVEGILPESAMIPIEDEAPKAVEPAAEPAQSEQPGKTLSQEEIEKMLSGGIGASQPEESAASQPVADVPQTAPTQPVAAPAQPMAAPAQPMAAPTQPVAAPAQPMAMPPMADASMLQMQMMQQMMQQMQQMQQQMQEPKERPEPKMINVQPVTRPNLTQNKEIVLEGEQEENMELIMGVPLEISVEIGRTRKLVKDILDFTKGSLVVLDKLAGEQVDLLVNGQCIAKGDVVVVEDNFGIRITEIMKINFATLE